MEECQGTQGWGTVPGGWLGICVQLGGAAAGLMEAEVHVLGLDICNSSWKGLLSPAMLCTHSGNCLRPDFCSV